MGGKNSKISPTGVDQGALVSILQALRNRLLGAPGLTFGSGSNVRSGWHSRHCDSGTPCSCRAS